MAAVSTPTRTVVLVGAESAGKTCLAAALAGRTGRPLNVAGATTALESFDDGDVRYVDTPGLVRHLDTATTATTLQALRDRADDVLLLVVRATDLDGDLAVLLPLAAGRHAVVAVTHWDRVATTAHAPAALSTLRAHLGVPVVALDARRRGPALADLRTAIDAAAPLPALPAVPRIGWRVQPAPGLLERPLVGPPLALMALLGPAAGVVAAAVALAGRLDPVVTQALTPLAAAADRLPPVAAAVVAGDYGLLTMGPLLLVWAAPVVLALAALLGVLKASGLLDRLASAVDPLLRPVGLGGRDLVRVVAGFGCNVPAVVSTRSCATCSRDATVGAIAFGSACSYQLGATVAVLSAAGRPGLVLPYLGLLLTGMLVHARLLARRSPARHLDIALLSGRAFLTRPRWVDVRREMGGVLRHVGLRALPVFALITVMAAVLAVTGLLDVLARSLSPLLAALRLPGEAALPVVLASVRKDGLLLLAEPDVAAAMDGAQLLAALVLAGALLPCLVTALTIARERGRRVAARLVTRQAALALVLAATISWIGPVVVR